MDAVIPRVLEVLTKIRLEMQMGKSVSRALSETLSEREDPFSKAMKVWCVRVGAGQEGIRVLSSLKELNQTPGRRHLMAVLERGLQGSPIDQNLADLEKEFLFQAECRYEEHLQTLPLKLLVPLTLLILPGVMMILIAPIFFQLVSGF